jgi:hypothetical protein
MQGYRSKMEDAHVIALGLPTKPTLNAFGVFDGHGGSQAAIYCQKHFVDHIDEIKSLSPDEVEAAVLKLDDKFLNGKIFRITSVGSFFSRIQSGFRMHCNFCACKCRVLRFHDSGNRKCW